MVKALSYFRRRPELTVEAFQDYWRSKHPEVVTRLPGIRGYVQSHTLPSGYRKARPLYDGIAEVWFEDTAAMRALAGTPSIKAVEADEAKLDVKELLRYGLQNAVAQEFTFPTPIEATESVKPVA